MDQEQEIPEEIGGESLPEEHAQSAEETAEALRGELKQAQARVEELERERFLLSAGVSEEDLDYYAFKIGRLVTEETDFRTAAKRFLKEHRPAKNPAHVSTGASLAARPFTPPTVNETMNRLLRGN